MGPFFQGKLFTVYLSRKPCAKNCRHYNCMEDRQLDCCDFFNILQNRIFRGHLLYLYKYLSNFALVKPKDVRHLYESRLTPLFYQKDAQTCDVLRTLSRRNRVLGDRCWVLGVGTLNSTSVPSPL